MCMIDEPSMTILQFWDFLPHHNTQILLSSFEAMDDVYSSFDSQMDDTTSSSSTSSEEDREQMFTAFICYSEFVLTARHERVFRTRVLWDNHVDVLIRENMFHRTYRMNPGSFAKLVDLLRPSLQVDHKMSMVSSGGTSMPIIPEVYVHCFIRYISGGSHLDIRLIAQISKPSFYTCLHTCVRAINKCPEVDFQFSTEEESLRYRMRMFQHLSSHAVIRGCVGCIDGVLIGINRPSLTEVPNSRDYFSGHYQICDHAYRFLWVGVLAPGSCSDMVAYRQSNLKRMVDALPPRAYIIGDNAYPVSEHLLIPFSGSQGQNVWTNSYNFHLSQVRIKIEQTFGIFVSRWGVFRTQLQLSLKNVPALILA